MPGQTYRFRIINGGSLLYQTVCFEGHNVTVIAADATPTEPISFGPCVDVNSGQRYTALHLGVCVATAVCMGSSVPHVYLHTLKLTLR